jgi:hypothetical protein
VQGTRFSGRRVIDAEKLPRSLKKRLQSISAAIGPFSGGETDLIEIAGQTRLAAVIFRRDRNNNISSKFIVVSFISLVESGRIGGVEEDEALEMLCQRVTTDLFVETLVGPLSLLAKRPSILL